MMLLSLALLASCASEDGPMDDVALTEFATRYAAAWSSQDPAALAAFYAEDGSLTVNDGKPSVGLDAVEETARAFMTGFPDMIVRMVEVRQEGGHVVFHWHWTGTNTGPGGTGNAVDLRGFEKWILDGDGLIQESLGHFDAADYQRQLGAGADETGRIAIAAATAWLRLVDELEYRKSWSEASALLRAEVSQADWVNNLSNMRGPLGGLKQRVVTSSEYHESLDGIPDGNYVLFTYDSSYENREHATEIVALAQEANSSWRVIGYYFP